MAECGQRALSQTSRTWDAPAVDGLLREQRPLIIRTVARICGRGPDLPDIAQDAAVAIARSMGRFRGECRLTTWVVSVAARVAIKHARRNRSRTRPIAPGEGVDELGVACPEEGPVETLLRREFVHRLEEALAVLTPDHRAAIVLFHIEGLSLLETAEAVGSSVGTVKSRLHYGRRELKRLMEPYLEGQ